LATCLTFFLANGSFFLFLALYLQQGRGLSALDSGLVFIAVGLGFFAALVQAERVTAKLGRQILAVGAVTTGGGYALLAVAVTQVGSSGSVAWLIPGLLITGFGLGLVLVPLTDIVLVRITPRHAGAAAGVLATAQQLGGALGVAVVGVVYYGTLKGLQPASHAEAFTLSLAILTVFTILAAALVQLLPPTTTQERSMSDPTPPAGTRAASDDDLKGLLAMMPYAATLGISLQSASADEAIGSLAWAPELCTAGRVMHGGALISLADTVGAVCAFLGLPSDASTATTRSTTHLFAAVRDGSVTATARPLHRGRSLIIVQTELTDTQGRPIAQITQSQAVLCR